MNAPSLLRYLPERRTALVLCGTGAHGAYHAGVLRALQEAGVKIDLVAGHGIGAAGAALAAIDGGARLWEAGGLWRSPKTARFYGWRPSVVLAGWLALAVGVALLVPMVFLAVGLVVQPLGFLLTMAGASAGESLIAAYASALEAAFAPESLPTVVPRLVMLVLVVFLGVAAATTWATWRREPARRRAAGGWWWRLVAAPFDVQQVRDAVGSAIWQLIRGAVPDAAADRATRGRRYAEVLAENLGQPRFLDLLLLATDLDARRDVIGALLREPFRSEFLAPQPGRDRRAEVLDLAGAGRDHALDLVAAAVTPPYGCDPAMVTFAADGYWRGETHRLCDRPGAVVRLLEEAATAGARQAIVVSAVPVGAAPHQIRPPRLDVRSRVGESLAAAEAAALRDGLDAARLRFDSVFVIVPAHNAVAPFDLGGAYDDTSDRRQELTELMERGYEDAYRQFIEPVVGDSGDQLAGVDSTPAPAIVAEAADD